MFEYTELSNTLSSITLAYFSQGPTSQLTFFEGVITKDSVLLTTNDYSYVTPLAGCSDGCSVAAIQIVFETKVQALVSIPSLSKVVMLNFDFDTAADKLLRLYFISAQPPMHGFARGFFFKEDLYLAFSTSKGGIYMGHDFTLKHGGVIWTNNFFVMCWDIGVE